MLLGLDHSWEVDDVKLELEAKRVTILRNFENYQTRILFFCDRNTPANDHSGPVVVRARRSRRQVD